VRNCRLFLVAAFATAGCVRERPLIQVVPPAMSVTILSPQISGASRAHYRTVVGHEARGGLDGGVLGWLIGSAVASGSEAGATERLNSQRKAQACNEHDSVRTAVEAELQRAGFACAALQQGAALRVKVIDFGLREVQTGFVVPYAVASAALESHEGENLWSATAESSGMDRRRPEAYDAESYCAAFRAVADDLASQLIRGPIRPLETR